MTFRVLFETHSAIVAHDHERCCGGGTTCRKHSRSHDSDGGEDRGNEPDTNWWRTDDRVLCHYAQEHEGCDCADQGASQGKAASSCKYHENDAPALRPQGNVERDLAAVLAFGVTLDPQETEKT